MIAFHRAMGCAVLIAALITSTWLYKNYEHLDLSSYRSVEPQSDYKSGAQKVLIILTQTRCGSSFTGETFASANNTMYLYEPLLPYGMDCSDFVSKKIPLLTRLLDCNFNSLRDEYEKGFAMSKWSEECGCVSKGLCLPEFTVGLLRLYNQACSNTSKPFKPTSKDCGYPLRSDVLSKVCRASDLIVTKITRICSLEQLEDLYQTLTARNKSVYVLHLVRDPRGVTASNLRLPKPATRDARIFGQVTCSRQRMNLMYLESSLARKGIRNGWMGLGTAISKSPIIAAGRYKRIRYEDMSTNPIQTAEEVFKFMDRPLPPEVTKNIKEYLHPDLSLLDEKRAAQLRREMKQYFSTVREPGKILNSWRTVLSFKQVLEIQAECADVMKKLGYTVFEDETKLKDMSVPFFT